MNISLIMFKEDGQRKLFAIEPGKTIIGRKEDCDLRIPLAEISRQHAIMIVEKEVATLRDMGSANGTYLNNKRITEHELAAGDHIVIGPVVFTVQIDGEPADVRPVHTRLERRATTRTGGKPKTAVVEKKEALQQADEDPISALEALAGSGTGTAINFDDFPGGPDDSNT